MSSYLTDSSYSLIFSLLKGILFAFEEKVYYAASAGLELSV